MILSSKACNSSYALLDGGNILCYGAEMLRLCATGFCLQDVLWRWCSDS